MSVQTRLEQFYPAKYKSVRNVNIKSQICDLKTNKTLTKKHNYTKSRKQSKKQNKNKQSLEGHPSLYGDVMSECTNANSTLDIIVTQTSSLEENTKIDISDCSIIYENISHNISTKRKEVTEYETEVIKSIHIDTQPISIKRKVSPSCNNNDLKRTYKMKFESSTDNTNPSHSIEADSEIFDTQHKYTTNEKPDFFLEASTSIKEVLDSPSKKISTFTPKTSSTKKVLSYHPENKLNTNLFFRTIVDREVTKAAVENLNLVKEGAIQINDFNLESIYTSNSFKFKYNCVDTKESVQYDLHDVVIPTESNAAHLFMMIVNVFANPINCGYFDKNETDFIFSALTLSVQAQMLLARMLKRKHSWHRVENLQTKYNIADDLIPICKELVTKSFFISAIENEELLTFFNMLQVDEIHEICRQLKLKIINKNKEKLVQTLLKLAAEKPLFPGITGPGDKLKSLILNKLGYCICLKQQTIDIFDKIFTLLMPKPNPQETLSDMYQTLFKVELGKITFPKFPDKRYPVFANTKQLIKYIEAKHELTNILNAIEKKQWETVRKIGQLAYNQWKVIMDRESMSLEDSMLPSHIRHFMPGYLWLKVLSKSINAFKKDNLMLPFAVEILHILIKQNCYMQSKKGMWYAELALIEMFHNKDLEASAKVILQSLKLKTLCEYSAVELFERAKKLVKRKKLNATTLQDIQTILKSMENRFACSPPKVTTIEAALVKEKYGMNSGKSKWCINNSTDSKNYTSVENIALDFYKSQGFNNGIHCEGNLPITLFFILFWEELYDIDIPGSFVTLYQKAPLDLFTKDFYENRKERIDTKLEVVHNLNPESLSTLMENKFMSYKHFESMISTTLFCSTDIKDIVYCLGIDGVVGLCEKLIHNYNLWKAGFPDLIVWNTSNKICKLIEVKGPGDKLSVKQTLWLQHLYQLGLDVEVCSVKDNEHGKIKRS